MFVEATVVNILITANFVWDNSFLLVFYPEYLLKYFFTAVSFVTIIWNTSVSFS